RRMREWAPGEAMRERACFHEYACGERPLIRRCAPPSPTRGEGPVPSWLDRSNATSDRHFAPGRRDTNSPSMCELQGLTNREKVFCCPALSAFCAAAARESLEANCHSLYCRGTRWQSS